MTNRITRKQVDAKVDIVNRMLGFDPETVTYKSVGAVQLYGAYGGWQIHQLVNEAGGVRVLSNDGCGPLRLAAAFLDGMITGLRMNQVATK